MEREFVPYSLALKLKELGFDEPCFGYRDGAGYLMIKEIPHCVISAPTFSQAFRWFREKHGYFSSPMQSTKPSGIEYDWLITKEIDESRIFVKTVGYFTTYEEAELECLKKLIEIAQK